MDIHDDIRFLTKTLEKFKKNQRRRSQIVEQTLLVWLRNNNNDHSHKRLPPTPKTSRSESIQSTTTSSPNHPHSVKKKCDDNKKKKKTLKGILSLRNNSKKSVSQQPSTGHNTTTPSSSPSSAMIYILLQWWRALIETVQFLQHTERTPYFDSLVEIVSRDELLYYDQVPAAVILGRNYTSNDVKSKWTYLSEYHELLHLTLNYAIDTADVSAVHPSTIIFCAHTLALCFFKVPGLAFALLQTLPVQEETMSSIRQELLGQQEQQNDVFPEEYSSYQARLCKAMPAHLTSCTEDRQFQIPLKSNGHWISRWKTSDRSLFIMFYQRYHIHLNAYIDAAQGKSHHHHPSSKETLPIQSRNIFLTLSPGYVHLASYLTEKVGSLLRSSIVEEMPWSHDYTATAVAAASTTSTQQQQQTPSSPSLSSSSTTAVAKTQHDIAELARPGSPAVLPMVTPTPSPTSSSRPASPLGTTANNGSEVASVPPRSNSPNSMAAPEIHVVPVSTNDTQQVQTYNGKPKGLDSAARRYAYCLTSCAIDPSGSASESNSRHQNKFDIIAYQDMINVWLRSITKSVSWTSPESVFCLIDFFENVINELQKKQYNGIYPWVDIPFILHTIHLLLTKADNTIIHMRTLAFVFTNFGFLTQRPELLDMLCNKILLHPYLFERFMVHWNSGVRIFFLQCLFWRIRPLWTLSTVQWGFKDGLKSSCDGSKCWNAWNEQYHNDSFLSGHPHPPPVIQIKNGGDDASLSEHRKCTLEIHLTLETLLASFLQQYTRLDSLLKDLTDRRDRHITIHRLQSNIIAPEPFLPTFKSKLTRVAPHSSSSPTNTNQLQKQQQQQLQEKLRKNPPPPLRLGPPPPPPPHDPYLAPPPEHLYGLRRRSRGFSNNLRRLSRTFLKDINTDDEEDTSSQSSGSLTPPRRHSTSAVFADIPSSSSSTNVSIKSIKQQRPSHHQQYYAVPSTYSSTHRSSNESSTEQESNNITSTSSSSSSSHSTCEDSAYASGRTTPTGFPSILYNNNNNTRKSVWPWVPEAISVANGWRYAPNAHTYASKAVAEMELIMNSSITSSVTSSPPGSSNASRRISISSSSILKKTTVQSSNVPEISVDWPKAWYSS